LKGKDVIVLSLEEISRYLEIDFAFEITFFFESLTSFGDPVEPEVVNSKARSE